MTTADKVKALRKKAGLTQVAFANHFGIPLRTITNWEQGMFSPPSYVLMMLERLCDIDFR